MSEFRFKSKNQAKDSILLVELGSEFERNQILKAARNMDRSDTNFKSIYINADMSEEARRELRKAREECKQQNLILAKDSDFYYGVRNYEVTKIYKTKSNPTNY